MAFPEGRVRGALASRAADGTALRPPHDPRQGAAELHRSGGSVQAGELFCSEPNACSFSLTGTADEASVGGGGRSVHGEVRRPRGPGASDAGDVAERAFVRQLAAKRPE